MKLLERAMQNQRYDLLINHYLSISNTYVKVQKNWSVSANGNFGEGGQRICL